MPHEPGKAFDTSVMCQRLLYVVLRDPIGEQCAALFALMPPLPGNCGFFFTC